MTKREAAVISAFNGTMLGNFSDMHAYAEEKLGRGCFTHEFASDSFCEKLKELSREDFMAIHDSLTD